MPDDDNLVHLPLLLRDQFGISASEGRRVLSQGAVRVDGEPVTDLDVPASTLAHKTLTLGKRRSVEL